VVVPPTDLPLLSQRELVQTFGKGSTLSSKRCFSTMDYKRFYWPSYISEYRPSQWVSNSSHWWSAAKGKVWCIRTETWSVHRKKLTSVVCALQ